MTADGTADYVDVVTVANMMMPATAKFVAWENVHAAGRLGYSTVQCQSFLTTHAEQLSIVREMLGFANSPATVREPSTPTGEEASPQARSEMPESAPGVLSGLFRLLR